MYFKKLEINKWQQFERIELELHDRLTILTGSNGCGKTTLLNLLARHSGWSHQSLSTPKKDKKTGEIKFISRFFKGKSEEHGDNVGSIHYSNDVSGNLLVKNTASVSYQVEIQRQQPVKSWLLAVSSG